MKTDNVIRIEMLSTGDEVLYGQIVDTNAAWLSDYLFQQGFSVTSRTTVGDNIEQLIGMLQERSKKNDILIVNGGLGPTSDDLSALAAAMANNEELVEHQAWLAEMERYFADRGKVMPPSNRKQAMLPKSAEMINNPVGTACGFMMTLNGCVLFFSPGVPSEFKVMVQEEILPRMRARYPHVIPPVCYRLTTLGRSESDIATQLENNLQLPEGVVLGYRSAMPIIELKLTGPSDKQAEMEVVWQQLKAYVKDNTLFEGTIGLPALVSQLLIKKGLSLVVSEQYTAGLMSYKLYQSDTPLLKSEVIIEAPVDLNMYAHQLMTENLAEIAVVIGELSEQENALSIMLVTKTQFYHYRLKYTSRRYSKDMQQEIFAMVVLDMLRRYLLDFPLVGDNIWLDVAEI